MESSIYQEQFTPYSSLPLLFYIREQRFWNKVTYRAEQMFVNA